MKTDEWVKEFDIMNTTRWQLVAKKYREGLTTDEHAHLDLLASKTSNRMYKIWKKRRWQLANGIVIGHAARLTQSQSERTHGNDQLAGA